jgi:drug/metabolite transporter (DMT)-like permease
VSAPASGAQRAGAAAAPDRSRWAGGVALGIAGATLFAAKGVVIKLAYRHGTDPTTLIALRMILSLPFFCAVAWWVERRTAPGAAPWRAGDAWRIVGLGLVGYYLASYLDFLGLQYVSAGLERVILYLNPTLVMLIGLLVLRRPVARREWLAVAVAYAGVLLVFWHDLRLGGDRVALGGALVFASAVAYAVYLVAGGELVRRLGSLRLTAWAMIVSCVACIAQALVLDPAALWSQPAPVYALSLVNAVVCTVLPVFMVMASVERVGSTVAAQLGMIGPAATIAMGAVFLGEPVTAAQLAGTAVVVAGIFLLTVRRG